MALPIGSMAGLMLQQPSSAMSELQKKLEAEYASAKAANEKRKAQAAAIYDAIIKMYQSGGAFEQAGLADIERQTEKLTGRETQSMIRGGLFGTTVAAGIPRRIEAEYATPARLKLEDVMMQRLSQAQLGKAEFLERQEDVYPNVGQAAQYAAQAGAGGGMTVASGGGPAGGPTYMDSRSGFGEKSRQGPIEQQMGGGGRITDSGGGLDFGTHEQSVSGQMESLWNEMTSLLKRIGDSPIKSPEQQKLQSLYKAKKQHYLALEDAIREGTASY